MLLFKSVFTVRWVLVDGLEKWRRRALFQTTKADESAIAAPAISGFSRPHTASGNAARL